MKRPQSLTNGSWFRQHVHKRVTLIRVRTRRSIALTDKSVRIQELRARSAAADRRPNRAFSQATRFRNNSVRTVNRQVYVAHVFYRYFFLVSRRLTAQWVPKDDRTSWPDHCNRIRTELKKKKIKSKNIFPVLPVSTHARTHTHILFNSFRRPL
jgi:hypothetical protein